MKSNLKVKTSYDLTPGTTYITFDELPISAQKSISNLIKHAHSKTIVLQNPSRRLAAQLLHNDAAELLRQLINTGTRKFPTLPPEASDLIPALIKSGYLISESMTASSSNAHINSKRHSIYINRQEKKVYKASTNLSERTLSRLKHEATALKYIESRNDDDALVAPKFINFDENSGILTIQHIHGTSIDQQRLANKSTKERINLVRNITKAYLTLHKIGVLHGDISKNNVVALRNQNVALIYFEFAYLPGEPRQARGGSLQYLSPEVARYMLSGFKENYGLDSEIFSLGSLFFHILTGKPLFDPCLRPTKNEYLSLIAEFKQIYIDLDQFDDEPELGEALKTIQPLLTANRLERGSLIDLHSHLS